jgi:anti-anti-sigma factor
MAETRQLTVRGRYDCIPAVASFVAEAAEAAGLDDDAAFHCRMAVDEACTNVIEHAYGGEDVGAIQVTCAIEPGVCTIEIIDHGQAFNPDSVPVPQIAQDLEHLNPGGIGLHLMRKMMDEVSFRFEENRNILHMKKTRPVQSAHAQKQIEKHGITLEEVRPHVWVVSPEGRMDAASVPKLDEALADVLDQGRIWLIVDMRQVSYISSRGLKTLVSAWRHVGDAGGNLVLFGMVSRVTSVFDTVGFTHLFDMYDTLDAAIAAAAAKGY